MRVPVLATFPSKDPLIESAMSANESQRFIIREETLSIPPGMTIDPNAVAIPLGSNSVSEGSLAQQAPEQSEYYAISAFIDVEDPAEIPEQVEGVPVHSNPVINRFAGGLPQLEPLRRLEDFFRLILWRPRDWTVLM